MFFYNRFFFSSSSTGQTHNQLLLRTKDEDIDRILRVNLKSVISISRHVAKSMLQEKRGSIVNIGSVIGSCGNAGQVVYSASKAGLIGKNLSFSYFR